MNPILPDDKKATERLANERTFLAWIRTSISIISLGFVVAKFSVWMHELVAQLAPGKPIPSTGLSLPIGVAMMTFGAVLAVLAAWHYRHVNRAIDLGDVQASRRMIALVTCAVVVLAASMIAYMILTSEHL